jgi:xanthine dehydrogenase accessory factor
MNELDSILELACSDQARAGVLATVVHVKGSAYRRPGARMLILPDGRRLGSVSGGCLESDVCRKAWWFTEGGQPSVRVYDTTSAEDAVWEFGLGCDGQVHVLFERVDDEATRAMLEFVAAARRGGRAVTVATVVAVTGGSPARAGDRLLVDSDGVRGGRLAGTGLEQEILGHAREAFLRQKSHLAHVAGCDVFVEAITPPLDLVVFGAGHDAQPLVTFAKSLGWRVTVADGRLNYATHERFPEADRVVVLGPNDSLQALPITRSGAVVIMTHNYPQDVLLLRGVIPARPRYLGLLGPKSRTADLLEEVGLSVTGIDVHAPVGLDLGSDNPVSIAMAIVGEIQAVLHGRGGGMLKDRLGSIHEAVTESGTPGADLNFVSETAVCELA